MVSYVDFKHFHQLKRFRWRVRFGRILPNDLNYISGLQIVVFRHYFWTSRWHRSRKIPKSLEDIRITWQLHLFEESRGEGFLADVKIWKDVFSSINCIHGFLAADMHLYLSCTHLFVIVCLCCWRDEICPRLTMGFRWYLQVEMLESQLQEAMGQRQMTYRWPYHKSRIVAKVPKFSVHYLQVQYPMCNLQGKAMFQTPFLSFFWCCRCHAFWKKTWIWNLRNFEIDTFACRLMPKLGSSGYSWRW